MSDKVTPIAPGIENYQRLDEPYKGPADAIYRTLASQDFDKVINDHGEGWVEVRIIARFSETAAVIEQVHLSEVVRTNALQRGLDAMRGTPPQPTKNAAGECVHHWESPVPGMMACRHCGISLSAKAWADTYAPKKGGDNA